MHNNTVQQSRRPTQANSGKEDQEKCQADQARGKVIHVREVDSMCVQISLQSTNKKKGNVKKAKKEEEEEEEVKDYKCGKCSKMFTKLNLILHRMLMHRREVGAS